MTHAEMDMESNTSAYISRVDVEFVHVVLTVREKGGESETSNVSEERAKTCKQGSLNQLMMILG